MPQAKLSQKHQIVIPKAAREEMKVRAGDRLIVETIHGVTVLIPKPRKIGSALKGASKGLYGLEYLADERKSWQR